MSDMENRVAELFGFQHFEKNNKLQGMIDDTLKRYDNDIMLSDDDLCAAAGGLNDSSPQDKGSDRK